MNSCIHIYLHVRVNNCAPMAKKVHHGTADLMTSVTSPQSISVYTYSLDSRSRLELDRARSIEPFFNACDHMYNSSIIVCPMANSVAVLPAVECLL